MDSLKIMKQRINKNKHLTEKIKCRQSKIKVIIKRKNKFKNSKIGKFKCWFLCQDEKHVQ